MIYPNDDDLERFDENGPLTLPATGNESVIEHEGARIWSASYGAGRPVILLHGGLGHSGNWGYQVQALISAGFQAVVIDSRGHGRSTRDAKPYSYELMASDVLAVMDSRGLEKAVFIGWSDGACTALVLASKTPDRVAGVLFFGCNMDPSGTKPFEFTPVIGRCLSRHKKDYAQLSVTPDQFEQFSAALSTMQRTQPNYSACDLARIRVPVEIVHSEHDEFIKLEHAQYLSKSIPGASLTLLQEVSHFAPLQRPDEFNRVMLSFAQRSLWSKPLRSAPSICATDHQAEV